MTDGLRKAGRESALDVYQIKGRRFKEESRTINNPSLSPSLLVVSIADNIRASSHLQRLLWLLPYGLWIFVEV
jgi:hypothetical protein